MKKSRNLLFLFTILLMTTLILPSCSTGNGVSPTAALPQPTNPPTITPTPTFTATATTAPTPTTKPLPSRWDDPEVMARVMEKFEENRELFDQIQAGTLIYHGENGKEVDVKKAMRGYWYSEAGPYYRGFGDYNVSAGAVGRKGLLLAHETIQYSPNMQVEVNYFVLYNRDSDTNPFRLVPFVVGVTDTTTGEFGSVRLSNALTNKVSFFNSQRGLTSYLDNQLKDGLPMYILDVDSVVDTQTGSREPEVMEKAYLLFKFGAHVNELYTGKKDVMQRFILDYYTDTNYPAFASIRSEQTAAGWGGADLWVSEAAKTRAGLFTHNQTLDAQK